MPASDTASNAFSITLFGPIQVQIEGRPLPVLRSRKALWLLVLLALRHNRPVEREWLAGTLWPEVDQTRAFSNLRPIVSELRQALGSQAYRLQSPNRHTLLLDLTGADLDVRAFDDAIGSRNISEWEQAVVLYRGPLLEGCPEEWAFPEREKREQDCLQALQTLGDSALEAGDYTTAAGYYRSAVALNPWREAARRGLMEALAYSGDRNAALHVYREYVAKLKETPPMTPAEETRALYNRLRAEASQKHAPDTSVAVPAVLPPAVMGYVPHALTELIGREEERIEVADSLRRSRLVTLTGVGGIGKTRLAMSLASDVVREYADGVWLVALDSLFEDQQVFAQIASVLGVKEKEGQSLPTCLTEYLRRKRLLLVLDNCEHLLKASAEAAGQLLRECAEVRILATSREALGITGETIWIVPSLPAPAPTHLPEGQATLLRVLMGYESVQLFIERAQAVQKTFALTGSNARTIAQICFRLEGIPLAIELAAALVRVMTAEQIAERLDSALGILTSGSRTAQPRQQTLRATLEWSYELLSAPERSLLQRLSVFAGGWTLEAAEAICTDSETVKTPPLLKQSDILPLLTGLVDKSLVTFVEENTGTSGRFRMLEMVRQFASEQLAASGEAPRLMARHQEWFIAQAEEAETQLRGAEQAKWLTRLATEYDNLRVIFARSEQGDCLAERALCLACALRLFWFIRGDYGEGRKYLGQTLRHRDAQTRTPVRARALNGLGVLERNQGDSAVAQALLEESLAIRRELNDSKGMAETTGNLGSAQYDLGNYAAARVFYEESLTIRRELNNKTGVALMLSYLGAIAQSQGDLVRARDLLEESLLLHRDLEDRFRIAWDTLVLGSVLSLQGDLIQAETLYEESLLHARELGDKNQIAWIYNYQGKIAIRQGDHLRAQALFQEGLSLFHDLDDQSGVATSLQDMGEVAFWQGDLASAHSLLEDSLSIFKERRHKSGIAWTLSRLGTVAYARSDDTTGRALFQECLSLFREMEEKIGIFTSLHALASAVKEHDIDFAVSLWGAADALGENIGTVLPAKEQEQYERHMRQARTNMGEDIFLANREAGRAMTWEQAVDYALEKLDSVK